MLLRDLCCRAASIPASLLFGLLLVAPVAAVAASPSTANDTGSVGVVFAPDREDCDRSGSWSSIGPSPALTDRLDCMTPVPGEERALRISYLRRTGPSAELGGAGLEANGFPSHAEASAGARGARAPYDRTRTGLELEGGWDRVSYRTDFGIAREARVDHGHLLPERRSEGRLRSGYDFGLVKSRLELAGSHAVEEIEPVVALQADPEHASNGSGRLFLDLAVPDLPILTLGAGHEIKDVSYGAERRGQRVGSDVASATVWYGRPSWQAYAVTSFYSMEDQRESSPRSVLYSHFLSGSVWPSPTLTVTPSLHYMTASYDGGESTLNTLAGNFIVTSTGIWREGLLSLYGGYTANEDTGGTVDYRQLDLGVGAERSFDGLRLVPGYRATLGLTVGYSHITDFTRGSQTSGAVRSLLTVRIAAH